MQRSRQHGLLSHLHGIRHDPRLRAGNTLIDPLVMRYKTDPRLADF